MMILAYLPTFLHGQRFPNAFKIIKSDFLKTGKSFENLLPFNNDLPVWINTVMSDWCYVFLKKKEKKKQIKMRPKYWLAPRRRGNQAMYKIFKF